MTLIKGQVKRSGGGKGATVIKRGERNRLWADDAGFTCKSLLYSLPDKVDRLGMNIEFRGERVEIRNANRRQAVRQKALRWVAIIINGEETGGKSLPGAKRKEL